MSDATRDELSATTFSMERQVLEAFARGASPREVLEQVCRDVEKLLGEPAICTVLVVRGDLLVPFAALGLPSAYLKAIGEVPIVADLGSCGAAVAAGTLVVVSDTATHPNWSDFRDLVAQFELGSCWAWPVRDRYGEIVASFAVYGERGSTPSEEELELVRQLSDLVATIVSRANLESDLVWHRERLELMLEATSTGVWEWTPHEGGAFLSNRGKLLLGDPDWTFDLTEFVDRLHPEDRALTIGVFEAIERGEIDDFELELRYKSSVGNQWVWLLDRGWVRERDASGKSSRVAGTLQDITARKEDEARLERQERLESLGELAGGVGHDLNNVLQALLSGTELAEFSLPPEHPARKELDRTRDAIGRAAELTHQLRVFARGGRPNVQHLCIRELVPRILRFDLAGSGVRVDLDLKKDLRPVMGDEGRVREVLSNVILNARAAMNDVGHLRVSIYNEVVAGDAALCDGNFVRIDIRDEGPGIPVDHLHRIFDPYFQTPPGRSGLGLAIVHSVMAAHGGAVRVESTIGEGTTISLLFPAAGEEAVAEDSEST